MKENLVNRSAYLDKLKSYMGKPVIKIITGMRRSGKSSLMQLLRNDLLNQGVNEDRIIMINKESLEFDFIRNYQDLYQYLKDRKPPFTCILIDEIQEIREWEKAAASILADGWGDLYITGSNAALLSSELATLLTGRYLEIPVYPLGFSEFLDFRRVITPNLQIKDEFKRYLQFGGLPGLHAFTFEEDGLRSFLSSILGSILLKDVVQRYAIRDVGLLERITQFLMSNCGSITTAKSIADFFKSQRLNPSVDSVINYLAHLSGAYLFYRVKRYDITGKRTMELYDKYYCGDFGLRQGIVGFLDRDISGILENAVFLELLRRGYQVSVGSIDTVEVDFVAEKSGLREYYQVATTLGEQTTRQREFGSLELINDQYPKYVLTLDEYQSTDHNGIHCLNLVDWLLG